VVANCRLFLISKQREYELRRFDGARVADCPLVIINGDPGKSDTEDALSKVEV